MYFSLHVLCVCPYICLHLFFVPYVVGCVWQPLINEYDDDDDTESGNFSYFWDTENQIWKLLSFCCHDLDLDVMTSIWLDLDCYNPRASPIPISHLKQVTSVKLLGVYIQGNFSSEVIGLSILNVSSLFQVVVFVLFVFMLALCFLCYCMFAE